MSDVAFSSQLTLKKTDDHLNINVDTKYCTVYKHKTWNCKTKCNFAAKPKNYKTA